MFLYAIVLATELSAVDVLIETSITGGGRHVPDVLGIRKDDRIILVECKWSTGEKFREGGPKQRLADDTLLRQNADIHFIIGGPARAMRKWLASRFELDGIHDFDEMIWWHGRLRI